MRGRAKRLSIPRRWVIDIMRFAVEVPAVPVQRPMNLGAVIAARNVNLNRLPWSGIFAKAYAITARDFPALRQVYLARPWPHLYEYPHSIATIAVERTYAGEPMVFGYAIEDPASLPLNEIGRRIRHAEEAPIEDIESFRHLVQLAHLPVFLRRPIWWLLFNVAQLRGELLGTFGVSVLTAMGGDIIQMLPIWTTFLSYGLIRSDGSLDVRITIDHRVLDGATAARALVRLEEALNGPILRELQKRQDVNSDHASSPEPLIKARA